MRSGWCHWRRSPRRALVPEAVRSLFPARRCVQLDDRACQDLRWSKSTEDRTSVFRETKRTLVRLPMETSAAPARRRGRQARKVWWSSSLEPSSAALSATSWASSSLGSPVSAHHTLSDFGAENPISPPATRSQGNRVDLDRGRPEPNPRLVCPGRRPARGRRPEAFRARPSVAVGALRVRREGGSPAPGAGR